MSIENEAAPLNTGLRRFDGCPNERPPNITLIIEELSSCPAFVPESGYPHAAALVHGVFLRSVDVEGVT